MQAFYGTRISDHISETPENFLVCHSAPLCRTGYQKYRGTELGLRTDDLVDVYRAPETVFSQKFLASLEGKPVTDRHPEEFLNVENARFFMRGHVQHVQPGPQLPDGEQSVIGDLVITDPMLIQKIKAGVRDLSVGYTCEYTDNGDGTYSQTRLRANHVAVVETGRAQNCRIMDGVTEEMIASSESRSFDDLADEIHQSYNPSDSEEEDDDEEIEEEGFSMSKANHLEALVRQIVTQEIAKLVPRDESIVENEDASPALIKLRRLKPFIEKSGDRQAIDNYNRAVKALKSGQPTHLISALDALPWRSLESNTNQGTEFVTAINRARARLLNLPETEPEKKAFGKRAADSTSRTDDEEWHKDAMAMGRRMREGKIR